MWLNNSAIGGNKFRFSARSNHIAYTGAMLTKCKMEIRGSNNSVDIGKGTRLRQASIFIQGKGNRLVIHDDCVITAKIELIGDNCLLEIGQGTNIRSTFLATFENDSRIVITIIRLKAVERQLVMDVRVFSLVVKFCNQLCQRNLLKSVHAQDLEDLGQTLTQP